MCLTCIFNNSDISCLRNFKYRVHIRHQADVWYGHRWMWQRLSTSFQRAGTACAPASYAHEACAHEAYTHELSKALRRHSEQTRPSCCILEDAL